MDNTIKKESELDPVKVVQYLRGISENGNSVNITVDDAIQKLLKDGLDTKFGSLYYDKNTIKYLVFADTTNRDLYINDPVTNSGLVLATWDAPASINEGYLFTKNDNAEVVAKMYAAGKCASSYGMTKAECQAVTNLGSGSSAIFYNDTNLKSFDELRYFIGLTSLGDGCFQYCTSLTSITLPDSITSIGNDCFNMCTSLTNITLSNSITSIGIACFYGCNALTSIILPNSITSIGNACFNSCTSLTNITLSNNITSLEAGCFYGCTSLTSITLPDNITSLGDSCFNMCTSLTSITLPNSINSLGDACFLGCSKLDLILCLKASAPNSTNSSFGNSSITYTGSASTATKYLYVPSNATGYEGTTEDGWVVLLDTTKCNFKISKTL